MHVSVKHKLSIALPELDAGKITDTTISVGIFTSVQNGAPGAGQCANGPLRHWYEADLFATLKTPVASHVALSGSYC